MQRSHAILLLLLMPVAFWVLHSRPDLLLAFGPKCYFHEWTHLYCPGCGGTRAALLLLRGDILGALRMNMFAVIVLACIPVGLAKSALTGKPINWAGATGKPGQAIAVLVVAFFVLRNIPLAPFTYLAPIELQDYNHRASSAPPAESQTAFAPSSDSTLRLPLPRPEVQ